MNTLKDKPFALLGANTLTADPKKLKAVMVKEQMNWRSFASQDAFKARWNNPGTPSYYVLDHQGIIRHKWVGNPGARAIETALERRIGEVPQPGAKAIK